MSGGDPASASSGGADLTVGPFPAREGETIVFERAAPSEGRPGVYSERSRRIPRNYRANVILRIP